jgi:hypothetical protein
MNLGPRENCPKCPDGYLILSSGKLHCSMCEWKESTTIGIASSRRDPPDGYTGNDTEWHECPSCHRIGGCHPHGLHREVLCGNCGHSWCDDGKVPKDTSRICKNCVYWDQLPIKEDGICHRWPPVCIVDRGLVLESRFPSTYATTWCGEFSETKQTPTLDASRAPRE